MKRYFCFAVVAALGMTASAATITFNTDPFAGSSALTTPGRQIVGGELFTNFNIATDTLVLHESAFGVGPDVLFVSSLAASLPTGGVNVVVLQTTDDDLNPATPFGAGSAANLIAAMITDPGAGFFAYFNSNLGMPRLVYSTDLSVNTADLKILARFENLAGAAGSLGAFSAANFEITAVPETGTFATFIGGGLLLLLGKRRLHRH